MADTVMAMQNAPPVADDKAPGWLSLCSISLLRSIMAAQSLRRDMRSRSGIVCKPQRCGHMGAVPISYATVLSSALPFRLHCGNIIV